MTALRALFRSERAATAAEFALLIPLLLTFVLGTIDVGRYLWTCNRAEKATQMGVRYAVVTDIVPSGLSTYDFVGVSGLAQGDPISSGAFTKAYCTEASSGTVSCVCVPSSCPWGSSTNKTAFDNIVARMRMAYPALSASHVLINYDYAGLGYAGDPNGIQVSPLVTIKLSGMNFTPLLFRFFGRATLPLPAFSASLTLEDGSGSVGN
ncbi:MAG: pilus assembly protein [Candidatus Sphingomonas colombiensis]|nr:TadE family protein [Sphingomonas sp.]WEK42508.1 MAG: pilus assembly protein [Sphingomonas sp.]